MGRRVAEPFLTLVLVGVAAAAPEVNPQGYVDDTGPAGLTTQYMPDLIKDYHAPRKASGGVAVFDADGDGLDDIFWPAGSAQPSRLYVNQGGHFLLAEDTGLEVIAPITTPSFADYDDDGDFDLYLQTYQDFSHAGGPLEFRCFLFRNDGGLVFTDVAEAAGLDQAGRTGASWGDLDGDGLLDVVTVSWRWAIDPLPGDLPTYFWRNDGDGTFTNLTSPELLDDYPSGLSPTIVDYDDDGDMDVLSANDFESSRVYRNDGHWRFTRVDQTIVKGGPLDDTNGMGSAIGDVDHDGHLDWFVTSIWWPEPLGWGPATGNRLWRGAGDGSFIDVTTGFGVLDGGWGWAAQILDVQNDARPDIAHVNGWYMVLLPPPNPLELQDDTLRIFVQQPDATCIEAAAQLGVVDSDQGRGLVAFDADRDGLLDLLVSNNDTGLTFYRATHPDPGGFLEVRLRGTLGNSHGIGARVTASHPALPTQTQWITHGSNYLSQSPPAAWFGLADVTSAVSVRVDWPSGLVSFHQLQPNQHVVLHEPAFGFAGPGLMQR